MSTLNDEPIITDERNQVGQFPGSLLGYFAGQALKGITSNSTTLREITEKVGRHSDGTDFFQVVTAFAYEYARAMIVEREKLIQGKEV